MKKILSLGICLLCLSFLLQSCNEDDHSTVLENSTVINEETYTYKFSYNGKTYSSEYTINSNDLTVVYKDSEVENILSKFIDNNNYAVHVNEFNEIELFDNFELFKSAYKLKENNSQNKANEFTLNLYKDHNFTGASKSFQNGGAFMVSNLGVYGFNDVVTSFSSSINNHYVKLAFFRDHNYQGASIIFTVAVNNMVFVPNIGVYRIPGSKYSWNDQITSLKSYYE